MHYGIGLPTHDALVYCRFRSNLIQHRAVHKRPYICSICHKRFDKEDQLRKHLLAHPEAMLTCTLCKYAATDQSDLNRHIMDSHAAVLQEGLRRSGTEILRSAAVAANIVTSSNSTPATMQQVSIEPVTPPDSTQMPYSGSDETDARGSPPLLELRPPVERGRVRSVVETQLSSAGEVVGAEIKQEMESEEGETDAEDVMEEDAQAQAHRQEVPPSFPHHLPFPNSPPSSPAQCPAVTSDHFQEFRKCLFVQLRTHRCHFRPTSVFLRSHWQLNATDSATRSTSRTSSSTLRPPHCSPSRTQACSP